MIRLATLFSGIGAIEQAFLKQNIDHEIIFISTTTAHLNSHNYKFSVSFLENIPNKRVLE